MDSVGRQVAGPVEWGVAAIPLAGESANGDLHVVQRYKGGTLVAAIDALGHGPQAALVALRAAQILIEGAGYPLIELCRRLHQGLIGGRGVVVSLATFDSHAGVMTWAGIGNVEGVLVRRNSDPPLMRSSLVTLGGTLGAEFPDVRPQRLPIEAGDVVVFGTDGVQRTFVNSIDLQIAPERLAAELLRQHNKGTDDALVLVARYTGTVK